MKKSLLLLSLFTAMLQTATAQRYLQEVFTGVDVTSNVVYGQNISVLTGFPDTALLIMDVYQPSGDTATKRPLVIYLHTGSFLPIMINGGPTGSVRDSATAEMCRQFARRGYVAVAMDYRLGWNPIGATQDIRTGTLLQAVYRALQDAKTCVRYCKMTVAELGNPYKIDTNKIVMGGQGSGGYVALAYATLDDPAEIQLQKFISTTTDLTYGFVAGQPYVNQAVLGDYEGFGGLTAYNLPNWPGYGSKISMVFNMGGALGDSSWMAAGDVPMMAFHVTNDPFAPYGFGTCQVECSCPVIVPTTGQFVVNVAGSLCTIHKADDFFNNNSPFHAYGDNATDPYTLRANAINNGHEGLFPFELIDPSIPIPGNPFHGQAGPWEWWDSMDLQILAPYLGVSAAQATGVHLSGFLTNPDMSKDKGLRYIDTIQSYMAPRIVEVLQLPGYIGIPEIEEFNEIVHMFPNPAAGEVVLQIRNPAQQLQRFRIYDAVGRLQMERQDLQTTDVRIATRGLTPGMYLVNLLVNDREVMGKLMIARQ